jgi:hypothetical protein
MIVHIDLIEVTDDLINKYKFQVLKDPLIGLPYAYVLDIDEDVLEAFLNETYGEDQWTIEMRNGEAHIYT